MFFFWHICSLLFIFGETLTGETSTMWVAGFCDLYFNFKMRTFSCFNFVAHLQNFWEENWIFTILFLHKELQNKCLIQCNFYFLIWRGTLNIKCLLPYFKNNLPALPRLHWSGNSTEIEWGRGWRILCEG